MHDSLRLRQDQLEQLLSMAWQFASITHDRLEHESDAFKLNANKMHFDNLLHVNYIDSIKISQCLAYFHIWSPKTNRLIDWIHYVQRYFIHKKKIIIICLPWGCSHWVVRWAGVANRTGFESRIPQQGDDFQSSLSGPRWLTWSPDNHLLTQTRYFSSLGANMLVPL